VGAVTEAVALENDTVYGLTGRVVFEHLAKVLVVARQLRTDIVHVND
jgi:acyl-CoA reductase-like NAD-dependent aldehyde dehydrogenase